MRSAIGLRIVVDTVATKRHLCQNWGWRFRFCTPLALVRSSRKILALSTLSSLEVMGIDPTVGLPCRVPGGCEQHFKAVPLSGNSVEAIRIAAGQRDTHEHLAHAYTHSAQVVHKAEFSWAPSHRIVFQ